MQHKEFYSVIIGTELLNGRREDAHFDFVNSELVARGWEHKGNFMISDDVALMISIFTLMRNNENSVMFCFGGIGATPDDYTREIAARIFTDSQSEYQEEAKKLILDRFGEAAYPNRIEMAYLPKGAKLLENPINRVPGFYLDERFFFVPGFPEMAKPMVLEALNRFYPKNIIKHRKTVFILRSEENLIEFMKSLPESIEMSSLPIMKRRDDGGFVPAVTLSLACYQEELLEEHYGKLIALIHDEKWEYTIEQS